MKNRIVIATVIAGMALCLTACGAKITGVNLPTTMTVEQGSTEDVSAEYLTSKTLSDAKLQKAIADEGMTWASSDDTVAAVDDAGQITGIAPGTATITVTSVDGKVSGSIKVRVVVTPTGLTVPDTVELVINGESEMALDAKMTPETATDASLAFESSDDAVVTVDESGALRAVSDGESTITTTVMQDVFMATAEAAEPSFVQMPMKLSAKTKVTVVTAPKSIALDKSEGILYVGGTHTINAALDPVDCSANKLVWSSDNENIATVDVDGTVTAKAVGTAVITAKAEKGSAEAQYTLTVAEYKKVVAPTQNAAATSSAKAEQTPAQDTTQQPVESYETDRKGNRIYYEGDPNIPEGGVVQRPDGSRYVKGPLNVIFGYEEGDPDPNMPEWTGKCVFCGDDDHDVYSCPILAAQNNPDAFYLADEDK